MKNIKGPIIVGVVLLTMAFLLPAYAQSQSDILAQDRDQDCIQESHATRADGEEQPMQTNETKPEKLSEEEVLEEVEDPIQEQTQTREQLRDCISEKYDCNQHQYQYQYRYGQEEQN